MVHPTLALTLSALADDHRRAVVEMLRREPRRAGDLADALSLSPAATSRHLRILRQAGLIAETGLAEDARVRMYHLEREPFRQLQSWLDETERYWTAQLDAFAEHVRSKDVRSK